MNRRSLLRATVWLVALTAAGALSASASPGTDTYRLDSAVIAGGGAVMSGGGYRLAATVGQHAAATVANGALTLHGGFWFPADDTIFRSGFDPS